VRDQFQQLQDEGYGAFPICMAKTQYSFSTVPVREVRLAAGAEFIVVVTGQIMIMPGLPRVPAANRIGLDAGGNVVGLF